MSKEEEPPTVVLSLGATPAHRFWCVPCQSSPFLPRQFVSSLARIKRKSADSGGSTMSFDASLAQIIYRLQRQGRVSYRALKMRLNLDDEYLDVLKEELLYVHPVRDDEGRGLVWTGATASVK